MEICRSKASNAGKLEVKKKCHGESLTYVRREISTLLGYSLIKFRGIILHPGADTNFNSTNNLIHLLSFLSIISITVISKV